MFGSYWSFEWPTVVTVYENVTRLPLSKQPDARFGNLIPQLTLQLHIYVILGQNLNQKACSLSHFYPQSLPNRNIEQLSIILRDTDSKILFLSFIHQWINVKVGFISMLFNYTSLKHSTRTRKLCFLFLNYRAKHENIHKLPCMYIIGVASIV